jgi:hypothetical protein
VHVTEVTFASLLGPPADEFLEADRAISIRIGGLEREQTFVARQFRIELLQQTNELFVDDPTISVAIHRIKRLSKLFELSCVQILHIASREYRPSMTLHLRLLKSLFSARKFPAEEIVRLPGGR